MSTGGGLNARRVQALSLRLLGGMWWEGAVEGNNEKRLQTRNLEALTGEKGRGLVVLWSVMVHGTKS